MIPSPYTQFNNLDGTPLENGQIYIGTAGLNPETSPVTVYWDSALTQPAAQPIRTVGGYPARNGTPSPFYSAVAVSMTVKDKNGVMIFYAASVQDPVSTAEDYADALFAGAQPALGYTPVNKAGDTMLGLLTLSGAPTLSLHAATKAYADSVGSTGLPLTGGTMAGAIAMGGFGVTNSPNTVKAQGCFSGEFADVTLFSGTYVRSGTTITVSITGHGFSVGHQLWLQITSGSGTSALYEVLTADANTFTVTDAASGATSGGCSFRNCLINASTGGFSINYANQTANNASYFLNLATSQASGYFTAQIAASMYNAGSNAGEIIYYDFTAPGGRRVRTSKSMAFSVIDRLGNSNDAGIYSSVIVFHN